MPKGKNVAVEHKSFMFNIESVTEVKSEDGQDQRVVEGYASVFGNVDSYGDIVEKGAFSKTLQEKNRGRKVKFLWQHDPYNPIGVPELQEDSKGLRFKAMFADTQKANEAYNLAKMGAIDGVSIGYRTIKAKDNEDGTRSLQEVELLEISLVTFEANTQAKVTDVKNSDFESALIKSLKKLGHSHDEAVKAVKDLSLDDDEPDNHSSDQADRKADKAKNDSSREMQESIMHSIKEINETLKNSFKKG